MRPDRWAAIAELAARQHGLVSVDQAEALGVRSDARKRAIAGGLLLPARRRVLRVAGAPASPWEELMAACLAAGPATVACRGSAAALHGLPVAPPPEPQLVVADAAADELAATANHRSRRLPAEHCTVVQQVPCTTVERTIIDLAADSPPSLLHVLVGDADRRRLCRPADIERALCQITRRGRRGVAKLQEVVRHHASGSSGLEATWLRHLQDADLPDALLQHQVVLRGRVLLLDAAWPAARVALEIDGWDAHRTRPSFDADAQRGNLLTEAGWRVVHATSRSDPHVVTGQIRRLLAG